MIDLLCMGTCMVTDSDFYPNWPEPLVSGMHYVSAEINRPVDTSSASRDEYKKIVATIMPLVNDEYEQQRLRENSAAYFDNYAAPEQVGEYILSQLMNV